MIFDSQLIPITITQLPKLHQMAPHQKAPARVVFPHFNHLQPFQLSEQEVCPLTEATGSGRLRKACVTRTIWGNASEEL